MLINQLQQLGLSVKEAKVYLASLELGESTVQEIAKKAEVNRPTTYVQIESLMQRGLISSVDKGKKRYFIAESPNQLLKLLDDQKSETQRKAEDFKEMLPELKAIYNLSEERPRVRFFEGKKGLEVIKDEILKVKDKKMEAIFSVDDLDNVFSKDEKAEYFNRRLKQGIKMKGIYTRSAGSFDKTAKGDEIRVIPKEKFPITVDITIFSDRVALSALRKELVGVIIESKEIADTLRSIFNLAWEASEKYNK